MSAVVVQGDPITPARDSVGSVCAPAAAFSAPACTVVLAPRPRRAGDRVLRFSDVVECECARETNE
jgi:hypothetical protein